MRINKSRESVEGIFTAMELAHLRCQLRLISQMRPHDTLSDKVTPFWNIHLNRDDDGCVSLIQGNMEILEYNPNSGIITLNYNDFMRSAPKSMVKTSLRPVATFLMYMLGWCITEHNGTNQFVHDTMLRSGTRKKVKDLHGLLEHVVGLRYGQLYDPSENFVQETCGGIGVYNSEGMLQYWSTGTYATALATSSAPTVAGHFNECINNARAVAICVRTENNKLHCEMRDKLIQAHRQRVRQIQLAEQELRSSGKSDTQLVVEYRAMLPNGSSVEFIKDRIVYNHNRGSHYQGSAVWLVGAENAQITRELISYIETPGNSCVDLVGDLEVGLNQYKAFLLSQLVKVNLGIKAGFPITDPVLAQMYVVYMTLRENGYTGTFEDYSNLSKGK